MTGLSKGELKLLTVSVERELWAAHSLELPDGSREPEHFHNFLITVAVKGEEIDEAGVLIDFKVLKEITDEILHQFDNNALEQDKYFLEHGSSTEVLAKHIYEQLKNRIPQNVKMDSVKVVEEPGCSVLYAE